MQLFQLKNYNVIFEPVTMTIAVFAAIRDKNDNEERTLKEMAFIWFYADVRSDYNAILNDEERKDAIRKGISLPDNWRMTDEVKNAIEYYKANSKTPSSGLYNASVNASKYVEKMLSTPEALLEKTDAKGNLIYKLDNITKMLKDLPDIMKKLHEARIQVVKELEADNGLKGNKAKTVFEDGI